MADVKIHGEFDRDCAGYMHVFKFTTYFDDPEDLDCHLAECNHKISLCAENCREEIHSFCEVNMGNWDLDTDEIEWTVSWALCFSNSEDQFLFQLLWV